MFDKLAFRGRPSAAGPGLRSQSRCAQRRFPLLTGRQRQGFSFQEGIGWYSRILLLPTGVAVVWLTRHPQTSRRRGPGAGGPSLS